MDAKIGVLALQGAFAKHRQMLNRLNIPSQDVHYPTDLDTCTGLIIPGGESTTITKQIRTMNFLAPLKAFAFRAPIFGTCAGMILMAQEGILNLIDMSVKRNAYGRQKDSFTKKLTLKLDKPHTFHAIFIRAPRITAIHSDRVEILAEYQKEPLFLKEGFHLATAFHPELTNDPTIHEYFIQLCKKNHSSILMERGERRSSHRPV